MYFSANQGGINAVIKVEMSEIKISNDMLEENLSCGTYIWTNNAPPLEQDLL